MNQLIVQTVISTFPLVCREGNLNGIFLRQKDLRKMPRVEFYLHIHFFPLLLFNYKSSMCVQSLSHACLTLFDSVDCSPPDSCVNGILQARILEWVAISFSRGFSWLRDQTHISCVSCIGRWILYHWVTWEVTYLLISGPISSHHTFKIISYYTT